jgi:sulfite reductase alpha subunit-like flavoprotein
MKRGLNCGGLTAAALLICSSATLAQSTPAGTAPAPAASSASAGASKENLAEDIKLLRKDVRGQKSKIMGAAMGLDEEQSKKFWPIYKDYDRQLTKLNDVRVGNIIEYAKTYDNMTENKADELVNGAIAYRKKRIDLLANTYDKVRGALGAPLAARFLQVEDTLLNLIDLQIQSNLPLMWGPEKSTGR